MVVNEVVTSHYIWLCYAMLPLTFGAACMIDVFMCLSFSIWLHQLCTDPA